jgi:hypothetical protein
VKKALPLFYLLLFIASSATASEGDETQAPQTQVVGAAGQEGPRFVSLEQAVQALKDEKSAGFRILKMIDQLCAPLDRSQEESEREREISDPRLINRIKKEVSRYRVQFSIGDLANILDLKYFSSGANYTYVVEPAFRNNEQLRKDIWAFQIGARTGTSLNVGATTTVRFTFTRFYGGHDAKINALKACPYLPNQIPLNSNEVKSKLRNGDGFRFEVIGSTGLGKTESASGVRNGEIGLAVKTEALFLMDLFKLNNTFARVRLLGVKNRGEASVGFTLQNPTPLNFIGGRIQQLFTLGLSGSLRKTIPLTFLKDKYPLDTMMVDYLFRFSTPDQVNLDEVRNRTDTAEAALEELYRGIKRFGFVDLFLSAPGSSDDADERLGEKLLEKVKIAETLAKEDLADFRRGEIKAQDMRVRSFFKGRMQSSLIAGEGRLWFSEIFSKESQIGNLNSFVTSFDEDVTPSYYFLNSSFERGQTKKYFGRNRYNYTQDFDVLVNSDRNRQVGTLSDIVIRTEIQDTDMRARDLEQIKKNIQRSLPNEFKNDPKIVNFFPTTDQHNAFISHRFVFGHEAFQTLATLDRNEIFMKLSSFIENHPERNFMHIPSDRGEFDSGLSFSDYVNRRAREVYDVLDPSKSNEETLKAFRTAQRDPVFEKYIVSEFFTSLLPASRAESLFGLNLRFSSLEAGSPAPVNLGQRSVSPVYEAVSFLRSVINDPSLDMQIVGSTDSTGDHSLRPSNRESHYNLPLREKAP